MASDQLVLEGYVDVKFSIPHDSFDVPSDLLYHYTTTAAFRQIVESKTLWASGAYYMNDSSEVEYGVKIIEEVAQSLCKKHSRRPEVCRFLELLVGKFRLADSELQRQLSLYIACFCSRPDVLSQWRYYATRSGVAIGFRFNQQRPPDRLLDFGFKRVEYSPRRQKIAVKRLLQAVVRALAGKPYLRADLGLGTDDCYRLSGALVAAYNALLYLIAGFKDKAFKEEQEWRFVIGLPRDENERKEKELEVFGQYVFEKAELCFREGRFVLTPYLKLSPVGDMLPICGVCLAPWDNNKLAKNTVEWFLRRHGHLDNVFAYEAPARL